MTAAMKIQTEKFKPDGAEYQLYESFGFYRDPFITIETSPIKISTEFYIDDWGTQYVDSVDSTKSSNSEVYFAVATGLQNKVAPAFGLRIIGGNLIYMFDGGWSATTEIQNININAGEWHRLDYMYYPIDPNGTLNPDGTPKYPKGIVYYYIEGVKVAENPQSTFSVGDYLGNIAFYGRSTCIDAEDSEKGNTSVVFETDKFSSLINDGAFLVCDICRENFCDRAFYTTGLISDANVNFSKPEICDRDEKSVTVFSKGLSVFVNLGDNVIYEDNYFVMLPGEKRKVKYRRYELE